MNLSGLKGRRLPLLVAAALFAGGNLAFFLAFRSGAETRRASLEARRDALKKSVVAAESEAQRITGQRDRLGGVSEAITEFYGHRIGGERETLAPVVDEIHTILQKAGVAVPQISYSIVTDPKRPLTQMRIGFSVKCDYPRFKQLLRAFESSTRWMAIRDVGVSRDGERPGAVQVQLSLVTYFSDRDVPSEKPTPAARKGALPARRAG
jgi:hypothetical protein